jgi:cell division protein FtsB
MKLGKQHVARIFLCGEIIVFAGFYIFGTNGIMALMHMKKDIAVLDRQVIQLKGDVSHLQSTIALQKKHPFFQEKIAREQLQMARVDDEVYLINK